MALKLAAYVTAHTVRKLANGEISFSDAHRLLDNLGVDKVYLENYRSGLTVTLEELKRVADMFGDYEVAGGSCIGTWGDGWGRYADFGFKVVCLTDQRNLQLISEAMSLAGEVFDEILIDDFWANWCTCSNCVSRFNERYGQATTPEHLRDELTRGKGPLPSMWARFSTELLLEVTKKYVVEPAKKHSQNTRVVVKVAEWREDFYVRGLFIPALMQVFDGVYVGTESREATLRYGAYYNARLVKALAGEIGGTWLDTYSGLSYAFPVTPETYLEQLVASVAAAPSEITLFNLEDLLQPSRKPHVSVLEESLPELRSLAGELAGEPIGILRPALLPSFSPQLDRYLEDYLGSIALPLKPVPVRKLLEEETAGLVLVTAKEIGALDLEELAKRVDALMFTANAVRLIAEGRAGAAAKRMLGLEEVKPSYAEALAYKYRDRWVHEGHRRAVNLPVGPMVASRDSEPVLKASDGSKEYPVIFRRKYGNRDIYAVCLGSYPGFFLEYPEVVRQALRDIAAEYIGIKVSALAGHTSKVSVYPYTGSILVANYNDFGVFLEITVDRDKTGYWGSPSIRHGQAEMTEASELDAKTIFTLKMPRRSFALIAFR